MVFVISANWDIIWSACWSKGIKTFQKVKYDVSVYVCVCVVGTMDDGLTGSLRHVPPQDQRDASTSDSILNPDNCVDLFELQTGRGMNRIWLELQTDEKKPDHNRISDIVRMRMIALALNFNIFGNLCKHLWFRNLITHNYPRRINLNCPPNVGNNKLTNTLILI